MNKNKGGMMRMLSLEVIMLQLGTLFFFLVPRAYAADAVVSGACGETEFNNALNTVQTSGGGKITFSCGTDPFYIYFSDMKTISTGVTINGGDLAILSGQNTTRLFHILSTGSLTLKNLTVRNGNGTDNSDVPYDGGAVYSDGSLTVDHSKFLYNETTTSYSGGAVIAYGPLTIKNDSEFAYNKGGGGGAVYPRWGSVVHISDSNFHDNEALNYSSGWGGALLAWDGPTVTITNTIFNHNTANVSGGALFILANSKLAMRDSTLTSNDAYDKGGGAFIQGSAFITDTLFASNRSFDLGGGLMNTGITRLLRVTLDSNYAYSGGGGIFNEGSGDIQINKSIVMNNTASYFAGGISAGGNVLIVNSILANNTGGNYGEDIAASGTVNINFSTILNTRASVPGASIENSAPNTVNIKNSIIHAPELACAGPINSLGYNISIAGTCNLIQTGDRQYTDPMLGFWVNPAGKFLPVLPKLISLARDNGQCSGVNSDLRGLPRPVGASCDMGALERNPGDPVGHLFLPVLLK